MTNFTGTVIPKTEEQETLTLDQIINVTGVYKNRYDGYLVVMRNNVVLLVTDGTVTTVNIENWKHEKFRRVEANVNMTIKLK